MHDATIPPVNDAHIARLYTGIKHIDIAYAALLKAPMWEKPTKGEVVINETRDLLMHIALTLHSMKNDITRLQGEKVAACTLP